MEIFENIAAWPQILLEFGPYAILALFALWVAPQQLNKFIKLSKEDMLGKKVTGTIAASSWAIVVVLAVFITISWSPIKGYKGNLGKLSQDAAIFPADNIIYLNSSGVNNSDKEFWQFAVVSDQDGISELQDCVGFTIYWDDNGYENDYSIPVKFFLSNKVKDYKFKKFEQDASVTYIPEIGKWDKDASCGDHIATKAGLNFGWDAYADQNLHNILRDMKSSNRGINRKARKQMRSLPTNKLQELKTIANTNSREKRLIVSELKRRKN